MIPNVKTDDLVSKKTRIESLIDEVCPPFSGFDKDPTIKETMDIRGMDLTGDEQIIRQTKSIFSNKPPENTQKKVKNITKISKKSNSTREFKYNEKVFEGLDSKQKSKKRAQLRKKLSELQSLVDLSSDIEYQSNKLKLDNFLLTNYKK